MTSNNTNSGLEPRIIKGHRYLCKQTVTMCDIDRNGRERKLKQKAYVKGKVYVGDGDLGYPDETWHYADRKNVYGYLIDEQGQPHSWPYDPHNHSWCHDRWTDFFEDLGEA